jgi:hypothetical protein
MNSKKPIPLESPLPAREVSAGSRAIGAALPYAAVLGGLYLLRSAWLSILLYHAGLLIWHFAAGRPLSPRELLDGDRGRILALTVASAALAGPALFLLWPLLPRGGVDLTVWLAARGLAGSSWLLFIPYFSLVHPFLEELHWRAIGRRVESPFHWSDAAFAGYHILVLATLIEPAWLLCLFALLAAVAALWRRLALRGGGFLPPLLAHVAADAGVILCAQFLILRANALAVG